VAIQELLLLLVRRIVLFVFLVYVSIVTEGGQWA